MSRNNYKKSRVAVLFIMLALVLLIYAAAMYDVQVLSASEENAANTLTTSYSTITASRGSVLDRNGVELITSRAKYDVKINRSKILAQDDTNGIIFGLVKAAMDTDTEYTDTFPVTSSGPFEYRANMTETQRSRLDSYLEYFDLDAELSASDLIIWMRDHYGIDYLTSINDARLIIGVRYELELRAIMNTAEYVFAEDVGLDLITYIKEKDFPGVSVETNWKRVIHTDAASHILGYVGLMNAEEYEEFGKLGYPMNATVGKDGVESAFEQYLHGVDGIMATVKDQDGNIVDKYVDTEAQAGGNVFLSIDIYMQQVAERALKDKIAELNSTRKEGEELADGGAVVVENVNTGELLTCASYPTYDLSTMLEHYSELLNDKSKPLFNRATLGTYNPGSTFKMVTSFAGMRKGIISRYTPVEDFGKYTKYKDYQPVCWIYPDNHGVVDVVGALENSCNYFFYWLGDRLGSDAINESAANFGFGAKTGIEIPESSGIIFSADYKKEVLDDNWYAADTLIMSIGQSDMATPVQLANYVSSIANDGTLYKTTLLNKVMDENYERTLMVKKPSVLKKIEGDDGYLSILREGMEAVASTGTASATLGDYKVKVAAKTGTVQSDSTVINNGVFVCYAPADDPQIAISVVVENGGSGSAIIAIAKEVLDYYFSGDYSSKPEIEGKIG